MVWVPLGQTSGGDNTRRIISNRRSQAAGSVQKHLGLAAVRALVAVPSQSGSQLVKYPVVLGLARVLPCPTTCHFGVVAVLASGI
jgi:hypothetical protein